MSPRAPTSSRRRDRGVDVLRGADPERLHALRERIAALRLDEQVHVRALDAEVRDPAVLVRQHA